jgi:hypothetical protein
MFGAQQQVLIHGRGVKDAPRRARSILRGGFRELKFFDTPFSKFLILLAVSAVGIYWLYVTAPPTATTSPGALPEFDSGMRYCFEEKIRLGGARFVLEQQAESADVERFNRMVDAYNQRCGHRTVRKRDSFIVDAIQSEVRANRDALWAEGIARFPAAGR